MGSMSEEKLKTLFKFISKGKVDEAKEMIAEMTTEELNEELYMEYYSRTPLCHAVVEDEPEIVKALLEKRVDVEKENLVSKARPLHNVFGRSDNHLGSDVIDYLVDAGADVNAQDRFGETPLHHVVWRGYEKGVKVLIENGADVNAQDRDGETPIMEAKTVEVIDMLEKAGADIHATSSRGETILHYAARHGHLDVVKYLIEKRGFSPNQKDKDGETPLHEVVDYVVYQNELKDMVSMLIKKGADVNIKNDDGFTPLDHINREIIRRKNNPNYSLESIKELQECKRLLIKNGAKTSEQLAPKETRSQLSSILKTAGQQLFERDEMPVSRQTKSRD